MAMLVTLEHFTVLDILGLTRVVSHVNTHWRAGAQHVCNLSSPSWIWNMLVEIPVILMSECYLSLPPTSAVEVIELVLSICLSEVVGLMLRLISMVQTYVVHYQPALCTTDMHCVHHGAQGGPTFLRWCTRAWTQSIVIWWFTMHIQIKVHNACSSVSTYTLVVRSVAFYWFGGAQGDVSLDVCLLPLWQLTLFNI